MGKVGQRIRRINKRGNITDLYTSIEQLWKLANPLFIKDQ